MAYRATDWGLSTQTGEHWDVTAACRYDPEVMWPNPNATNQIEAARKVCRRCDHRIACILQGIADQDWESVRGGYTGKERAKYHKKGLAPAEYPPVQPSVVAKMRKCAGCKQQFEVTPDRPTSRHCRTCVPARKRRFGACPNCKQTKRVHARGLCEPCYRKVWRADGPKPAERTLRPCGTYAAYRRHQAKGERACQACMEFMRPEWQRRRALKREVSNANA